MSDVIEIKIDLINWVKMGQKSHLMRKVLVQIRT